LRFALFFCSSPSQVAGSIVAHPFGSVMRSILVAVYGLGAEHVIVVGHHDCGMTGLDPSKILNAAKAHGIPDTTFKTLQAAGLNLESWLSGFSSVQTSVQHSVDTIRNHPLLHCHEGAHSRKTSSADHVAVAPTEAAATTTKPRITVTGFVICVSDTTNSARRGAIALPSLNPHLCFSFVSCCACSRRRASSTS
jgi:hypothetical protein